MSIAIAKGINARSPELLPIFSPQFQTAWQWRTYFRERFGYPTPSVTRILERSDGLRTEDFHALYIACWLHFPVAKGSYMIRLSPAQRVQVKRGYERLGLRVSSHFEGHGRSAARGWAFLTGYDELLVQMEGGGKNSPGALSYLFLKCEGHTVYHIGHFTSWLYKIKHGTGMVASPALEALAANRSFGITPRAAENFDNAYLKLLRASGVYDARKKMTRIADTAVVLHQKMEELIRGLLPRGQSLLRNRLLQCHLPPELGAEEIRRLPNSHLAAYLTDVLIPMANELRSRNFDNDRYFPSDELLQFSESICAAAGSLTEIAARLAEDAELSGDDIAERNFAEIRIAPATLDRSLQLFQTELNHLG
ncbi:MAG TPA: hypothetical protein PKO07_10230 [Pseudomonadota bacterium]|nr:hypothetical protein [Pseudomonadota bacterium]